MEFRVPELGEGVYEAELVAWHVQPGDAIKRGQHLVEVITDKASFDVPAPFSGVISSLNAEPGQTIKVGDVILTYNSAQAVDAESAVSPQKVSQPKAEVADTSPSPRKKAEPPPRSDNRETHRVRTSPAVRKMADSLGIDLAGVQPSGPDGRILVEDLASHIQPAQAAAQAPRSGQLLDFGAPGTRLKFVGLRRKIAERMVEAKRTIPHYSYVDECDVTNLVRLRDTYRQAGVRMTYLPLFVKAAVAALKQVPLVNSSLDEQAGEIVLHDRYDIGIATATPKGLVVPVVRQADRKSLVELSREIDQLSSAARAGNSRREDLQGSTFTITSIGGIGGLISTPVINQPEVAILGIGKIVRRPVYDAAGNLHPADIVYLSFSFDHRVLDGAIGAAFGNALIAALQDPALWLGLVEGNP